MNKLVVYVLIAFAVLFGMTVMPEYQQHSNNGVKGAHFFCPMFDDSDSSFLWIRSEDDLRDEGVVCGMNGIPLDDKLELIDHVVDLEKGRLRGGLEHVAKKLKVFQEKLEKEYELMQSWKTVENRKRLKYMMERREGS